MLLDFIFSGCVCGGHAVEWMKLHRTNSPLSLAQEPHSLKPKRYGTIVLSDAPLASSLSDMYFGEQHIPLPTVPGQPPRAKFTSPTKVQLAGIKDVAPLVGLRLSDSPKLWYNQTENQQEDMDDDDPGNQSGEDTSVEPWFELRLGRKELRESSSSRSSSWRTCHHMLTLSHHTTTASVSAKRTGAESKRLAADKAAFAKFKGFRHLVER